jgi:DNA-nicking Smr family endonuclease
MPRRKNQVQDTYRSTLADAGEEDGDVFRRAMADARPLKIDTVEPPRRRVPAVARFARQDERRVLKESLEPDVDTIDTDNGDGLWYRHPSVHRKTMRRLARGGFSVQHEIDLHGLTAAQSKEALKDFIGESLRCGHSCVRVVHGKGLRSGLNGPVLKRRVDQWLRCWDPVLAFVSARQADGGTGALYVLLKKRP